MLCAVSVCLSFLFLAYLLLAPCSDLSTHHQIGPSLLSHYIQYSLLLIFCFFLLLLNVFFYIEIYFSTFLEKVYYALWNFKEILVTKIFCSGLLGRVSMSSNSSTFSQSICLLLCSRKIGSSLEKDLSPAQMQ